MVNAKAINIKVMINSLKRVKKILEEIVAMGNKSNCYMEKIGGKNKEVQRVDSCPPLLIPIKILKNLKSFWE